MTNCFKCKNNLPDRGSFCPSCAIQVRCKWCKEMLGQGWLACAECGSLIGNSDSQNTDHNVAPSNLSSNNLNTIEFGETTKRRYAKATLTDTAVSHLRDAFAMFANNRINTKEKRIQQIPEQGKLFGEDSRFLLTGNNLSTIEHENPNDQSDPLNPIDEISEKQIDSIDIQPSQITGTDCEKLHQLFEYNENTVTLGQPQLKATGKLDYAKRLAYLFLYAHDQEGRRRVPRTELKNILSEAGVYDPHATNWIAKNQYIVKEGDQLGLIMAGRTEAKKLLNEALDPSRLDAWFPGSTSNARATKVGTTDKVEKSSKAFSGHAGRKSKVKTEWLPKWNALNLSVDGHSVLLNRPLLDKGILGLWAIRKALGEAGKHVGVKSLTKFLYEAFEIPVDARSLNRALKSKEAKGRVHNVKGTIFQVLPTGIEYAEQMTGLNKNKGATNSSTKSSGRKKV